MTTESLTSNLSLGMIINHERQISTYNIRNPSVSIHYLSTPFMSSFTQTVILMSGFSSNSERSISFAIGNYNFYRYCRGILHSPPPLTSGQPLVLGLGLGLGSGLGLGLGLRVDV